MAEEINLAKHMQETYFMKMAVEHTMEERT
jgi:hypothetical protein